MPGLMKDAENDYRKYARNELGKLVGMYVKYSKTGISMSVIEGKPGFLDTKETLELVESVISKGMEVFGSFEGNVEKIFDDELGNVIEKITSISMNKAIKDIMRKDGAQDVHITRR